MSTEVVKQYLKKWGMENSVIEFDTSSATVELAAAALGVIPARIAKSLAFAQEGGCLMIVAAGDVKIDNQKFKRRFSMKARMLRPDEALALTGHAVGGVCPFGLNTGLTAVYLDESLKRFASVYPAAGSGNSCIELTIPQLVELSGSKGWVDVCKLPERSKSDA